MIEPRLGTGRYFMAMGNSMNNDRASKALSGIADDLGILSVKVRIDTFVISD